MWHGLAKHKCQSTNLHVLQVYRAAGDQEAYDGPAQYYAHLTELHAPRPTSQRRQGQSAARDVPAGVAGAEGPGELGLGQAPNYLKNTRGTKGNKGKKGKARCTAGMYVLESGIQVRRMHEAYLIEDMHGSSIHVTAPPVFKKSFRDRTGGDLLHRLERLFNSCPWCNMLMSQTGPCTSWRTSGPGTDVPGSTALPITEKL